MKIKTQFIITMLLFGMIMAVVSASAIITNRHMEKTGQQESLAINIAQGANDLSYLGNNYLIYLEGLQFNRWQSRFVSFSNQVAGLSVEKPEQQALVRNIQSNQKRLKEVFDSIASALGSRSRDQDVVFDSALFQMSWSRMAVQSQALISDASRLSRLLDRQKDELTHKKTRLIYSMVGLFGLFILVSYLLTYRRVVKSIAILQAGTAVIGSGELDFKFKEDKNDEIGDLSRAFNQMTANLKFATASKVDLERQMAERVRIGQALQKSKERVEILSETASRLLATDKPQEIVHELCQKVMTHLDCHTSLNYLVDEEKHRLRLNAYAGIPEKTAKEIEWLDYGVTVCGCVARDGSRIICENIPTTPDLRTDLVKSFGIKAYACHPLFSAERVIGTLSFGTRSRAAFAEEELSLMKTVADQAAVAMERIRLIEALKGSRDELEIKVNQRTAELAKFNELLERMFSSVDVAIAYMDKNFNFIRVNRAYAEADERFPEFYIGRNHFVLFPNEENEQNFRKVVETGEPYSVYAKPFEYAEHPERGVTHWDWSLQPVKEPDGKVEGVVLSLVNVTERIQAQEAIDKERKRFNDVLEVLPAYVALLTPDYHIAFANRVFRERFGESREQRCFESLFARSEPCEICETYTVLKTGAPHQWEWTGPDGRIYDVFDFPFTDTDGSPLILEMGIDITERKRAEKNLLRMQKMEALGILAGGIAHDFNNILMPITINTEMVLLDAPEGSPVHRYLHPVLNAAKRGKDLVNQIITFSRQKELERNPIKIGPVIKEAIKFLRSSLPKNIEIHDRIDTEADAIKADPTQIHQILMNLSNNAAYAMREEGGVIGIRLTHVEVDSDMGAKYPALKAGPHLKLTVSDTGCGMPKEVIDSIFDPFFTTKKPGEGIGMGLAVVHSIVKTHGGAILVYSEIGKGTAFHIFFPRVKEEIGPDPQSQTSIPTGVEKILLVDDEEVQLKSVQQMLERFGYTVVAKGDSVDALNSFQEKPEVFDLVITDQTMPKMTGEKLAESILRIRPDISIILCTGFSEVVDADKVRAMGIREFVMKPFTVKEMAETIRKVLKK